MYVQCMLCMKIGLFHNLSNYISHTQSASISICTVLLLRGCVPTLEPEFVEGFFEFNLCESYHNSLRLDIDCCVCVPVCMLTCMIMCECVYTRI